MKYNKYYHAKVNVKDYPFESIKFNNVDYERIVSLTRRFNKSTDKIEKIEIAKQLPEGIFPICRICGNIIVNSNFKLKIDQLCRTIKLSAPKIGYREIDGKKYKISACEDCMEKHFGFLPKPKYYYMKANKYGQFTFGYSEDEYGKLCAMTTGITEKSMIRKYGEEEGLKRWNSYCNKRAEINSFEYKKKHFGWDKKTFDMFNKSRAVTITNLMEKYGEIEGHNRWNKYIDKQRITKSFDYMVNKFGYEKAIDINKSKASTSGNYYSEISQECFRKIDNILNNKFTTYFATKNYEYVFNIGSHNVMLDYYIKELNVCIEFNGTVFHGDPRVFEADSHPNPFDKDKTASDIWENDSYRYKKLNELYGIQTYVIWENDYQTIDLEKFINSILDENLR